MFTGTFAILIEIMNFGGIDKFVVVVNFGEGVTLNGPLISKGPYFWCALAVSLSAQKFTWEPPSCKGNLIKCWRVTL